MELVEKALVLARHGYHVFPLVPNEKTPAIKKFPQLATRDEDKIKKLWADTLIGGYRDCNIGISTSNYGDGQALLVIDVDDKNGKNGSGTLLQLELEGFEFPKTRVQTTPTGGRHLIYKVKVPVKQGTDVLGSGLDIRSRGGFIVGAGSIVEKGNYKSDNTPIADAPEWLIIKCNEKIKVIRDGVTKSVRINKDYSKEWALDYLENHKAAVEGQGGDHHTYKTIQFLRDRGVPQEDALEILCESWNDRCQPPWSTEELEQKIENAYRYGQNEVGADSPEVDFQAVEVPQELEKKSPVEKLNEEFAFIVLGGKSTIIQRRSDGEFNYMSVQAFHDLLKSEVIRVDGRKKQLSEVWFASNKRATYLTAELHPGKEAPTGVFNLWRGFKVEPLGEDEEPTSEMVEGVSMFKEHLLKNVCLDNEELATWLMGYFAHMVQKPWQKPLTALVFKGDKGVGKNALIDRVGKLFGSHYMLTSNRRFVVSNFNKHLAQLVLFVLDEAFWSGDKQAEGILKDLITGHTHLIEHKGREMFSSKNVTRLCIIGNEEWVVPASKDERRFAVFNVSDARQGQKSWFKKMRKLIDEQGGNRLLLRELMDFDLSQVDVNQAPETEGLVEQKLNSLEPLAAWWYSCLRDGGVLGSASFDFTGGWPTDIGRTEFRDAFNSYSRKKGVRWLPDASLFGKQLKDIAPGIKTVRKAQEGNRNYFYRVPPLEKARQEFCTYLRCSIEWEDVIEENEVIDETEVNADTLFS